MTKVKLFSAFWFFLAGSMLSYNFLKLKQLKNFHLNIPENVKILEKKLSEAEALISKEKIKKEELRITSEKPVLPVLEGIIKSFDSEGNIHRIALIDGKLVEEGSYVNGFFVKKITENGVYLSKYNRDWFIKIPEIRFSVVER